MLTYEEFVKAIVDMAEAETGSHVTVTKVRKVNGFNEDGLVITAMDCNLSPTIYLGYYYEQYKNIMDTELEPVRIVWNNIYSVYKKNLPLKNFDVDNVKDYEKVKDNLRIRLVNFEKNKDWLDDLVFISFLDLAIIFSINVCADKGTVASITIKKDFLNYWGKTEEELFEQALDNSKNDYEINSMEEIMRQYMDITAEDEKEIDEIFAEPMYVLSNTLRLNGASAIFCENVLKRLAEQYGINYIYIIPSSLHEVILLAGVKNMNVRYLKEMVREVNDTQLEEADILSYSVYVYDAAKEEFEIC